MQISMKIQGAWGMQVNGRTWISRRKQTRSTEVSQIQNEDGVGVLTLSIAMERMFCILFSFHLAHCLLSANMVDRR